VFNSGPKHLKELEYNAKVRTVNHGWPRLLERKHE
jgi:hypothetical protein